VTGYYFSSPLKKYLLKKLVLVFPVFIFLFTACRKSQLPVAISETCIEQTANPVANSYDTNDVVSVNYTRSHCGMMPLSAKNYWVYQDSLFDNSGAFKSIKLDTLRYTKTFQTPDHLIWWEGSKDVGLPKDIYSSSDAIYGLQKGTFMADSMYSKREFYEADADTSFLAGFADIVAFGKIINKTEILQTEAGSFPEYILYEKYAPGYRRDRIYFVPGFGVIKYTSEYYKAPGPPSNMKLLIKSSLVSYHSEN
jgi:hypothetical protein